MSIPFASLSLDKYVNKAGTDVGFGCLLAVALLVLLYFAAARETRTLREQLEDAHNRITSLEGRVTQALRSQAATRAQMAQVSQVPSVPGRPGVVPAPSVGLAGSALGRVPARAQSEMATAATGSAVTGALLGAPAGAGAPSLGSATRLIPGPELTPVPAKMVGVPAAVPAAATVSALSAAVPSTEVYTELDDDEFDEFEPDDTMYVPAGVTAAANGGRSGGGSVVAPPPSAYRDDDGMAGPPPRRTVPILDDDPSGPRRMFRGLAGALIALVIVAAIVVGLLLITNSGGSKTKTTRDARSTVSKKKTKKVVFNPSKVRVSVLNATGTGGLAAAVAKQLTAAGYTVPNALITNAAIQTASTSTVAYRHGFKADAIHVASALKKSSGLTHIGVVPANAAAISSCATTATGQVGSCTAKVIVTVGGDLQSAASGSTSG